MEFCLGTEVQQQPNLEPRASQIAQQLAMACGGQVVGRFHLDDDFALDEQIESLEANHFLLKTHGHMNFALDEVTILAQNPDKCLDVNLLEKPIPELVIHLIKGSDNRFSELTMKELHTVCRRHDRSARSARSAGSA